MTGENKPPYIHPSAHVQTKRIGQGTRIWQNVVVLPGAVIGENCNICSGCFIENDVVLGDNVTVKNSVSVYDGVRLENDVFIGPNATFTNDHYPRAGQQPEAFAVTTVQRGASVGANATLTPGITVGSYAMIGAGSVVTRDVPAYELWYGTPARRHADVDTAGRIVKRHPS